MRCRNKLVIVRDGDNLLRIPLSKRRRVKLTQRMSDQLVVNEVFNFVDDLIRSGLATVGASGGAASASAAESANASAAQSASSSANGGGSTVPRPDAAGGDTANVKGKAHSTKGSKKKSSTACECYVVE